MTYLALRGSQFWSALRASRGASVVAFAGALLSAFAVVAAIYFGIVTAAVTPSQGQPAGVAGGRYVIEVAVWPVGAPGAAQVFVYRHGTFSSEKECEDALRTDRIAAELVHLRLVISTKINSDVELAALCVLAGQPV